MNRQSWRPELPRAPEKQPIRRPSLSPGTRRLPAGCRRSRVRLDGRAPSSTTKPRKLGLDTRLLLSASGEQQRAAGSRLLRCSSNPSARPPHECTPASASQQRRYARAGAPHSCRRSSEPRSPCRDCPQQTATKHGVPRMHGAKRREKLSVSDTRFFGSCQPAGAPRGTTMASHDTHPRHHLPAWAASCGFRLSLIVAALPPSRGGRRQRGARRRVGLLLAVGRALGVHRLLGHRQARQVHRQGLRTGGSPPRHRRGPRPLRPLTRLTVLPRAPRYAREGRSERTLGLRCRTRHRPTRPSRWRLLSGQDRALSGAEWQWSWERE